MLVMEARLRKSIVLLVLVLLYKYPLTAQTKVGRESAGLMGPVETVHTETAKLTNSSGQLIEGQRATSSILTFNERGDATEQVFYNPDGSLRQISSWAYKYGTKGEEIEIIYGTASGKLTIKGISSYDKNGRKVKLTLYNPAGSINHIQVYVYDARGNKIQEIHRNPDGTVRNKILYDYDAAGRATRISFYRPDGVLNQRSLFAYDAQGRETEWIAYAGDESITAKRKQSYGIKSNTVETFYYKNGMTIRQKETYTDDVFDAHGNWVKRSIVREVINDGKSQFEAEIIYRRITYF